MPFLGDGALAFSKNDVRKPIILKILKINFLFYTIYIHFNTKLSLIKNNTTKNLHNKKF